MSRLEELIKKLCPNGVEYKKISSFTKVLRGKRLTKDKLSEENSIPVYHGGIEPLGYYGRANRPANMVMLINVGASAGTVAYSDKEFWSSDGCFCIDKNEEMDDRYLYHYLKNNEYYFMSKVRKAGIPTLDNFIVEEFKIPVPPLEVQCEIVRILDSFTLLTAELTAELTARKKQYQHYLNSFFENQKDNLVPLSSLGTITRGKRFVHADATETGVPCIHYGELYTFYGVHANTVKSHIREELRPKMRYAHKGDVIIVGAGENNIDIGVGVAWEGNEDVAVHDACYTLCHSQNSKYISFYLRSDMYHNQIKKYVSEGKVCSISATGLGKALIPLPSITEQKRIVSILDRFDSLCNDITTGLPAEIEARQKQYEFYRDKLLSFKQL